MSVALKEVAVPGSIDVERDHVSADWVHGANCGGEERQKRAAH